MTQTLEPPTSTALRVTANRSALLDALAVASAVVPSRSVQPALTCLLLTADGGAITINATDRECSLSYRVGQVQIEQPGAVLLPADKFADIVKASTDDTLSVQVTDTGTASVRGQDSHFKLFTQDVSGFPPTPKWEGDPDFSISAGTLRRLIRQTAYAASSDIQRYALQGVLFEARGKRLRCVASDGRRLALAEGDTAGGKDCGGIVPRKAMALIEKLASDEDEQVEFRFGGNAVAFRTGAALLTSPLLEGSFPPWADVIPKEPTTILTTATADLMGAVRRASLLTTDESKGLRWTLSKTGLVLTGRSPEAGESEVRLPCKVAGPGMEIGFNSSFAADALKAFDTDEVSVELTAPNRPGLFKSGANTLLVLMPISLS